MRVLVVGGGGREHALAWALANSPSVSEVHSAPGNPGMAAVSECHPVAVDDLEGVARQAKRLGAGLVVVGPEAPLAAGLADRVAAEGIPVFGPRAAGARLESSKAYAKQLMARYGIPTAASQVFSDPDAALAYVREQNGPLVVKADGLAAGKGVTVCEGPDDARSAVVEAMESRRFGDAGSTVLIEERMEGEELSILALCDGKTVLPLPAAQDYKRAFDGGKGPNTGGMGSYSPVPSGTPEVVDEAMDRVFGPLVAGLAELPEPYVGVVYAGLMLTGEGLKVVEFNCRFGDPEIQAVLPRMQADLGRAMLACTSGDLAGERLECSEQACVCVVAASGGYPEASPLPTGYEITGVADAQAMPGIEVFHAATRTVDGRLTTAGGRVLSVSALGDDVAAARRLAYEAMDKVRFDGMRCRTDIGAAAAGEL